MRAHVGSYYQQSKDTRMLVLSLRSASKHLGSNPRRLCPPSIHTRGRTPGLAVFAFRDSTASTTSSAPAATTSQNSPSLRNLSAGEHVSVPVDYYRLLQVQPSSHAAAIRQSYDALVRASPGIAYSPDTLFARAVLLKAASECLMDPELRRAYDAKLAAGHRELRVSQQDLPGTLVVLQEIGDYGAALELGARWLEANGSQPDAADVAAAMALAHCDRAGERLAGGEAAAAASGHGGGAVLPACDDLDAALARLRRYGMAPQMQMQIMGALRDLAPEYACELAALPLEPPHAPRRAKGVSLMRGVLRAAAAAGGGDGGEAGAGADGMMGAGTALDEAGPGGAAHAARRMLQRGRDLLTCGEQASLVPDALRCFGRSPPPDVMYDGALALLVDGWRDGQPHAVHRAEALLARAETALAAAAAARRQAQDLAAASAARREHYRTASTAAPPAGEEAEEEAHAGGVALERAVCCVLLGDYRAAAEHLGLGGGARGGSTAAGLPPPDPQLAAFVLANSPTGHSDPRPGLRALAARWLQGVALASFRDTAPQAAAAAAAAGGQQAAVDLGRAWAANPRVAAYLQVRRLCRGERVLEAAHFACNLLPGLVRFLVGAGARAAAAVAAAASAAQRLAAALLAALAAASARRGTGGSGPPLARHSSQPLPGRTGVAESSTAAFGRGMAAHGSRSPSPHGRPQQASGGGADAVPRLPSPPHSPSAQASSSLDDGDAGPSHGDDASGPRDLRSRLASSRAADGDSDQPTRRRASAVAATAAAAGRAQRSGTAAAARPAAEQDPEHEHEDEEEDGAGPAAGGPRRASEAELRAHLAGLEAAMWDSELPEQAEARKKKMIMYGAAALAVFGALLTSAVRRPALGASDAARPAALAAASMTARRVR